MQFTQVLQVLPEGGEGYVAYEYTYHYLVFLGGRVFLATTFLGVIRSRS